MNDYETIRWYLSLANKAEDQGEFEVADEFRQMAFELETQQLEVAI